MTARERTPSGFGASLRRRGRQFNGAIGRAACPLGRLGLDWDRTSHGVARFGLPVSHPASRIGSPRISRGTIHSVRSPRVLYADERRRLQPTFVSRYSPRLPTWADRRETQEKQSLPLLRVDHPGLLRPDRCSRTAIRQATRREVLARVPSGKRSDYDPWPGLAHRRRHVS